MLKGGGLAWLLGQERGIINGLLVCSVVVLSGVGGLGVYRERRRGKETINTKQAIVTQYKNDNTQCRVCPNAALHDTEEGGTHPGKFSRFQTSVRQMTGGGMLHVQVFRGITRICG
jgi:hypothetical protein